MRVVLLSLLLVTSGMTQGVTRPVRVGANFSVPMAYISPEGVQVGFFVEVFREAGRKENLDVQVVIGRAGPDKALESGSVDIWVAAVPTTERRRKFHVTEPWWSLNNYVASMASRSIRTEADLAGKVVVYASSPPTSIPLKTVFPGSVLRVDENLSDRFKKLCDGQIDAVLFYEANLYGLLGSSEFNDCRERGINIMPVSRPVMELSIMANQANAALAERFRKSIAEMHRDGSIEKLPSFRLTGDEQLKAELLREEKKHFERIWQLALGFTSILLAVSIFAYVRLKAAHKQSQIALKAMKAAVQAKRDLLATVSHELRTPMNGILGMIQLLLRSPRLPDQQEMMETICSSSHALLGLLNDILDLSRIEAGQLTLKPSDFMIRETIQETVNLFQSEAANKGLELTLFVDPAVPACVHGDPKRLRQILINYLDNGLKFTDRGMVRLAVTRTGDLPSGVELRFAVTDTGCGIPSERLGELFQVFTQIDSSATRNHNGAGLGLAITRNLASMMGGDAGVESSLGAGSTFWATVVLPIANPQVSAILVNGQTTESLAGLRVLVVEDNAVNRLVIRKVLLGLQCDVTMCEDGFSAVKRVETGDFDIVLMDVQMPGIDGLETARRIRRLGSAGLDLPIIAVTASAMAEDRARCAEAGMNGFMPKPISIETLEKTLLQFLPGTRNRALPPRS